MVYTRQPRPARKRAAAATAPGSRASILDAAWRLIAGRGAAAVTMAEVAHAAGVSRQTVYVQFGSRAGLLVEMVRHADSTNPGRSAILRAAELQDSLEALEGFVITLSRRWPQIYPVARALHAAALHDVDARAAWDDRMNRVREMARRVTGLLAREQRLAPGWTANTAADWLWSVVHPLAWGQLVLMRHWTQRQYEQRLVRLTRAVLVVEPRGARRGNGARRTARRRSAR